MFLLMGKFNFAVKVTLGFACSFKSASGNNKVEVCEDKESGNGVDLSSDFIWGCR